jgi:hypothetical protein
MTPAVLLGVFPGLGCVSSPSGARSLARLGSSFLPEHLHAVLCDFVELKQRLAKAAQDATPGQAPPLVGSGEAFPSDSALPSPLAAAAAPAAPAVAAAAAAAAGRKASWDASFMSEDPLAGLLQPDSPPPAKPSPVAAPPAAPKPKLPLAPAAAAAASAPGPLPSFFSHAAKKYDLSGEGLRDAIKAGDLNGCQQVLY